MTIPATSGYATPLLVPIVLAGGKGERFWPLSRRRQPKQFLCLDGSGRSLLQATIDRLLPLAGSPDRIWVVTGQHLETQAKGQLPELPAESFAIEPEGRDTAPALAWATLEAAKMYGEDTVLGFFPADHWIGDRAAFEQTLQAAAELATTQGAIVTLGMVPDQPATGYGYIEQGDPLGEFAGLPAYRVSRFTEKPDRATAEEFLASGRYSWNSGMFVFQAKTAIAELQRHAPEIMEPLMRDGVAAYSQLPKLSIDYALMEKTDRACIVPATFTWDDLGDWNAIDRLLKGDRDNVDLGQHLALDTKGAVVYASDPEELIVTIGLEDVVIVRDSNVTLIVAKDRTQDIKAAVKAVQAKPEWDDRL
ncbi:MAG: mannose-1-phosphate guanylyltransferase [Oscillatoriales cyanobacterium]|nr:MAG: mannose-1-phosphate guanylyltransferase [Oscillatoriales cyanobacterium]